MGATPPNAQARLDQAAQALRAIKGDWPQTVDAHVPADGGYLYGPVMEIVTDASEIRSAFQPERRIMLYLIFELRWVLLVVALLGLAIGFWRVRPGKGKPCCC